MKYTEQKNEQMSNFKNFCSSSLLISPDTPTQVSMYHSLSYQQENKSKQASKKHIFLFFLVQAHLILLSLHHLTTS